MPAERNCLIDFLKGFFILAILAVHSIIFFLGGFGFLAAISQAGVSGLVLLLAYNYFGSLERNKARTFYLKRFRSYAFWIALAWLASALLGLALGVPLRFGGQQLVGFFPVPGAGNYFVPLLAQLVVFAPLLFWLFNRHPLLFSVSVLVFWAGSFLIGFDNFTWSYNLLRFLPSVWIGFVFARAKFLNSYWGGVPVVNWAGRNSLKIFLLQVIAFSRITSAVVF